MALDHFDFYYAPLFGRSWPSIRLGLLTPNKFVAVINRYSQDFEVSERIIRDLGTVDVVERLNAARALQSEERAQTAVAGVAGGSAVIGSDTADVQEHHDSAQEEVSRKHN